MPLKSHPGYQFFLFLISSPDFVCVARYAPSSGEFRILEGGRCVRDQDYADWELAIDHESACSWGGGGTRLSRLPLDPPLAMHVGSVMLENFKHHFDKPPQMSHN